jgi:hypothetical protein
MNIELKPQDVVVLLKLVSYGDKRPPYSQMAKDLGLSPSEVHAAVIRARHANLLVDMKGKIVPNRSALLEFLVHGLRYVFSSSRGEITRGIPTSYAANPLKEKIVMGDDLPPVWPSPKGTVRGYSLSPLYKTAPEAAQRDPRLYEMLALIDAIRDGRSRERQLAAEELEAALA